MDSGFVLLLWM